MTTPDRLPTPDLYDGNCEHGTRTSPTATRDCRNCIALAISRARDDGIEVAARVAGGLLPCQFCTSEDRIAGEPCACDEQRERLAAVIRSLKEDRPR